MLNLRQVGKSERTTTGSDTQHVSRFSIHFRAPTDLLGNIGESLDHGELQRRPDEHAASTEIRNFEGHDSLNVDVESPPPSAQPPVTLRDAQPNPLSVGPIEGPPGGRGGDALDLSAATGEGAVDSLELHHAMVLGEHVGISLWSGQDIRLIRIVFQGLDGGFEDI